MVAGQKRIVKIDQLVVGPDRRRRFVSTATHSVGLTGTHNSIESLFYNEPTASKIDSSKKKT
jgi:hypothetical protein